MDFLPKTLPNNKFSLQTPSGKLSPPPHLWEISDPPLITGRNEVLAKVIFSQACVKNSVHRGGGVWSGPGGGVPPNFGGGFWNSEIFGGGRSEISGGVSEIFEEGGVCLGGGG